MKISITAGHGGKGGVPSKLPVAGEERAHCLLAVHGEGRLFTALGRRSDVRVPQEPGGHKAAGDPPIRIVHPVTSCVAEAQMQEAVADDIDPLRHCM